MFLPASVREYHLLMKQKTKNILFLLSVFTCGIVLSWLTFTYAIELNQGNVADNYEYKGIIYRVNQTYNNPLSKEAQITLSIKQALAENPETAVLNLHITTVGSRITISGKAENKDQIQSAIDTALKIPGVKEVISTIVIDPNIQLSSGNQLL